MKNKKIIEYNLDFYIIEQNLFEPDEIFYERSWYILLNLNNILDYETLNKKSRIITNMKYLECCYDQIKI